MAGAPLTLSPAELAWIIRDMRSNRMNKYPALNQRFAVDKEPIAIAVAMAESGGNCDAHNNTPPDDSYGAMQINMIGTLGPTRRALFGLTSNEELFNPYVNLRVGAVLSISGNNFKPWSTFTSGAYKKYLPEAQKAVQHPVDPSKKIQAHDTTAANDTSAGDRLMNWIGHGVFRAGMFVGGGVLLIGAITLAAKKGITT